MLNNVGAVVLMWVCVLFCVLCSSTKFKTVEFLPGCWRQCVRVHCTYFHFHEAYMLNLLSFSLCVSVRLAFRAFSTPVSDQIENLSTEQVQGDQVGSPHEPRL